MKLRTIENHSEEPSEQVSAIKSFRGRRESMEEEETARTPDKVVSL